VITITNITYYFVRYPHCSKFSGDKTISDSQTFSAFKEHLNHISSKLPSLRVPQMWPNLLYKLLAYLLILWSPLLSVPFTHHYSPKLVAQKYEKYSQKKKTLHFQFVRSLCRCFAVHRELLSSLRFRPALSSPVLSRASAAGGRRG